MRKMLFAMSLSVLLSACVTEEGAKKHEAKGQERQMQHAQHGGNQWHGEVYAKGAQKAADTGMFNSRAECMQATSERMQKLKGEDKSYSCSLK